EHVLSYCNAGHPAPILKRAVKPCELIHLDESVGIPLGVNPEGTWQSATVDMHPGDILILYTDGLTEAVSASGEQFGLARLESIVYDTENDPHILLEKIENALLEHQQGLDQTDDQTLVIVQPLQ
ncbi:PP2C family protein-serine/threonine phosphatase, partial [Kaarinaea lacus]